MNLFTLCLRTCAIVIFLVAANTSASAQTNQPENTLISNLKASVENNRLIINWVITESASINNCQVQASTDGITFSTIGIVMGADPKQPNSFSFKQSVSKMKPGKVFYRVVNMENGGRHYASNAVKVAS